MSTAQDPEGVDAETVGAEVANTSPSTLFRTDDPVQVLAEATRIADALAQVLRRQKLTTRIQGKEHVRVEGWQTLGGMVGVVPVVTWTRPLEQGWEARAEARTLDGRVVGAAEAECLRTETRWGRADDYAVRSMAQTRSISKALSAPLRFIVTLAGFEGTPAEEMPSWAPQAPSRPSGETVDHLCDLARTAVESGAMSVTVLSNALRQAGATDTTTIRSAVASLPSDAADRLGRWMLNAVENAQADAAKAAAAEGTVEEWADSAEKMR
jgi:hypothetical protein